MILRGVESDRGPVNTGFPVRHISDITQRDKHSMKPVLKIESVKVIARTKRATEVRVVGKYCGGNVITRTEISEGRDLPNTTLEGFSVNPADEFIVALHEALSQWEEGAFVATEMARITQSDWPSPKGPIHPSCY